MRTVRIRMPLAFAALVIAFMAVTTLFAEPKKPTAQPQQPNPIVTRAFSVKYSKPSDVVPLLGGLAKVQQPPPQPFSMHAIDDQGIIMVYGHLNDLRNVYSQLRNNVDKQNNTLSQYRTDMQPLQYASARSVMGILTSMFSAASPAPKFAADVTDKKIYLSGTFQQVIEARAAIADLDAPGEVTRTAAYTLKNVVPAPNPSTGTSSAQGLVNAVATSLASAYPNLAMALDPTTDRIAISGDRGGVHAAREMLKKLDKPLPVVELDVGIYDITVDGLRNTGLNVASNEIGVTLGEYFPGPAPLSTSSPPPAFAPPGKIVRMPISIAAQFNTLIANGLGHGLAYPQIRTLSGRTATLSVGDQISYTTVAAPVAGISALTNSSTVSTGVFVAVTPIATTPDGKVTMYVDAWIGDLIGYTPQGAPDIAKRETTTTLTLGQDEAIAISGMRSYQATSTTGHTYPFQKIPLLRNLFSNNASQGENIQTFVVIRPHIEREPVPVSTPGANYFESLNDTYRKAPLPTPTPTATPTATPTPSSATNYSEVKGSSVRGVRAPANPATTPTPVPPAVPGLPILNAP